MAAKGDLSYLLLQRHLQYYFLNKRLAQTDARSVLGYSPKEGIHQQREALLLFWTSKDRAREILQGFPLLILHPTKPPGTAIYIRRSSFHPPIGHRSIADTSYIYRYPAASESTREKHTSLPVF
jgi:hypothetical protein